MSNQNHTDQIAIKAFGRADRRAMKRMRREPGVSIGVLILPQAVPYIAIRDSRGHLLGGAELPELDFDQLTDGTWMHATVRLAGLIERGAPAAAVGRLLDTASGECQWLDEVVNLIETRIEAEFSLVPTTGVRPLQGIGLATAEESIHLDTTTRFGRRTATQLVLLSDGLRSSRALVCLSHARQRISPWYDAFDEPGNAAQIAGALNTRVQQSVDPKDIALELRDAMTARKCATAGRVA